MDSWAHFLRDHSWFQNSYLKVNTSIFEICHGNKVLATGIVDSLPLCEQNPVHYSRQWCFQPWKMSHTCFKPIAAHGNMLQVASDLPAGGPLTHLAQVTSEGRETLLDVLGNVFLLSERATQRRQDAPSCFGCCRARIWYFRSVQPGDNEPEDKSQGFEESSMEWL